MNWILSLVGKALGIVLLFSGGIVSTAILLGIAASHATGGILALLSMLLVFFGLAPALIGAGLLFLGAAAKRRLIRERFFQTLHIKQGRLSLLDFSAAARLEPAIARRHLDGWAREFNATFEVSDEGEIYYVFATVSPPLYNRDPLPSLNYLIRRLEGIF